jgi:hypothetical protein
VAPGVEGSNPFTHPSPSGWQISNFRFQKLRFVILSEAKMRAASSVGRAADS